MLVFNASPGSGAGVGTDGWPIFLSPAAMGGQKVISVELSELLYPMQFDKMEISVDSMGLGEDIGGPGVVMEVRPTSGPVECNIIGDGNMNPPYGTLGGTPGMGGGCYKENLTTGKRIYYSAKGNLNVEEDEIWVACSTGGGGRGDPLKRNPETVLESVFDGMVSLQKAKEVHGVVINRATMTVNLADTKKLRSKMRKGRGPLQIAVPDHAGAGDWMEKRLRRGEEYLIDAQ